MPDPMQQDHSLGEGGLMFGKYIQKYMTRYTVPTFSN